MRYFIIFGIYGGIRFEYEFKSYNYPQRSRIAELAGNTVENEFPTIGFIDPKCSITQILELNKDDFNSYQK